MTHQGQSQTLLYVKPVYLFLVCLLLAWPLYSQPANPSDPYGIDAVYYLTGRFNPARHPAFATTASYGIPDSGSPTYLRREALKALQQLHRQLQKDMPDTPFWIQSGTRTFARQKKIWEAKWYGRIPVGGIRLNTVKDPVQRARRILTYSSMPGTSRHHWGTDFDINILEVDYYRSGKGKRLFQWMLDNAPKYGFCLVYTEDRTGGYHFEPWHWSYQPLASRFVKDWEDLYHKKKINGRHLTFAGSRSTFIMAPEYVGSINAACR